MTCLGWALELKVTGRVNHCLECFCARSLLALKKLVWSCSKTAAQQFPARLCGRVICSRNWVITSHCYRDSSLSSVGLLLSELGCSSTAFQVLLNKCRLCHWLYLVWSEMWKHIIHWTATSLQRVADQGFVSTGQDIEGGVKEWGQAPDCFWFVPSESLLNWY